MSRFSSSPLGHPMRSARRAGFTLIELLVVIAIIALLASILFPVFGRAREMARRTSCLSNQKQMGNAFMMYAQDFDEGLPTWCTVYTANPTADNASAYWDYKLIPYVKSGNVPAPTAIAAVSGGVWHCPSSEITDDSRRSYGYSKGVAYNNDPLYTTAPYYRYPFLTQMDKPASTVLISDSGTDGFLDRPGALNYYGTATTKRTREAPFRHMEGANYLFADGHAKWMKGEIMYPNSLNAAWCSHIRYFAYNQIERDNNRASAGRLGSYPCPDVS